MGRQGRELEPRGWLVTTATVRTVNDFAVFRTVGSPVITNNAIFSRFGGRCAAGSLLFSAILSDFIDDVRAKESH